MSSRGPQWAQYAEQIFCLHPHIVTSPIAFREARWYLLKNDISANFIRLNTQAYSFISTLDGFNSLEQRLGEFNKSTADESQLDEDDVIQLINSLVASDFLKFDSSTDPSVLAKLKQSKNNAGLIGWLSNPLSLKFPVLNPDTFLDKYSIHLKFIFTRTFLVLWTLFVVLGIVVAANNSPEIYQALSSQIVQPSNLIILTLVFILIKCVHEFAHGFAVKHWGGNVHEMGITFLVFSPVPYVDATDAWTFPDKYKRILVSSMGVFSELFIASLAVLVWYFSDPGITKSIALNSAFVASVSTFVFNANPLLRFDGYYALQDWIEIPNLYQRSRQYLLHLLEKYSIGSNTIRRPVYAAGEWYWLLTYGVLSFLYRFFILAVISIYLINTFFIVGIVVSVWVVINQIVIPLQKTLLFVVDTLKTNNETKKPLLRLLVSSALMVTLFSVIPFPNTTLAKGVVWVDDQAQIYSSQDGFIDEIYVTSGTYVEVGTELLRLSAPTLNAQIQKMEARRRELNTRLQHEYVKYLGKSTSSQELLTSLEYELALLYQDQYELVITAKSSGQFFSPNTATTVGKHLNKGEFIGYVFVRENLIIQAAIPQSDIGAIRNDAKKLSIRLAENLTSEFLTDVKRETPSSSTGLPHKALAASNGGDIAVRNDINLGPVAVEEHFQVDFYVAATTDISRIGGIAYIRIDHAASPLTTQLLKRIKRLIKTKINIYKLT